MAVWLMSTGELQLFSSDAFGSAVPSKDGLASVMEGVYDAGVFATGVAFAFAGDGTCFSVVVAVGAPPSFRSVPCLGS